METIPLQAQETIAAFSNEQIQAVLGTGASLRIDFDAEWKVIVSKDQPFIH